MAVGRTGACVGSNLSQRGSSQLQLTSVDVRTYLMTRYRLSYPILANVHLRPAISFLAPEEVAVTWSVEGSQLKQLFRGVPCICSAVSSAHSLSVSITIYLLHRSRMTSPIAITMKHLFRRSKIRYHRAWAYNEDCGSDDNVPLEGKPSSTHINSPSRLCSSTFEHLRSR